MGSQSGGLARAMSFACGSAAAAPCGIGQGCVKNESDAESLKAWTELAWLRIAFRCLRMASCMVWALRVRLMNDAKIRARLLSTLSYRLKTSSLDSNTTSGCSATTYYPDDPVTHGQMAVFL